MLPLLGTLLFALIGIGALIIDGGLALTEQARLETAAEMMVSELAFVESLPDAELPTGCAVGDPRRAECIERFFLAPILAPLGVDFAPGVEGESEWLRADRSLDGTAIDARGARLGAFDDIETGLSTETPGEVRLSRSSPLLFGWAALAPVTAGGSRPDFQTIQAARAEEGLAPDLAGTGLRAEGFALQAEAKIDTAAGGPAMRVGLPVRFDGGTTGGLVGLAWRLDDLGVLDAALAATGEAADRFDLDGNDVRSDGVTVGCLFDVPSEGAYLGQSITIGATAGSLPASVEAAYVPVIRVDDCSSASAGEILGFLELGVSAGSDSQSGTAPVPTSVVLIPAAPARRNASGMPGSAAEAVAAGAVWSHPDRIALGSSEVWQRYGLRVPRVESVSPSVAGGASS